MANLPDSSVERKHRPVTGGVLDYFPLAISEVAHVSFIGNLKHNPGEPLHWARDKSTDHADAIGRHLLDRGKMSADGLRHSAQLAWRALAMLQIELEEARGKEADKEDEEACPQEAGAEEPQGEEAAPVYCLRCPYCLRTVRRVPEGLAPDSAVVPGMRRHLSPTGGLKLCPARKVEWLECKPMSFDYETVCADCGGIMYNA